MHVESAQGAIVRDVEGLSYIDFGGGIGVMNIGHSHPRVVTAKAQADKFTHTCFMMNPYGNVVRVLVPFVIADEQLEKGLSILEQGLKEISS